MKSINAYIAEKFQIGNDYERQYAYQPKDTDELIKAIWNKIDKEGFGTEDEPLSLNDIDTSKITDMNSLFSIYTGRLVELSRKGYFDISDWDVSNVEDMCRMFWGSGFDGDLSDWNVSKVTNMAAMFSFSKFTGKNGNINDWNVSKVEDMCEMFYRSAFNGNISDWDVSSIENMETENMFKNCPLQNNPPKWYKA